MLDRISTLDISRHDFFHRMLESSLVFHKKPSLQLLGSLFSSLALTGTSLQADLRTLSVKYGSFGDVFDGASEKEIEEQIMSLVRDVADKTGLRYQKELKLLPFKS